MKQTQISRIETLKNRIEDFQEYLDSETSKYCMGIYESLQSDILELRLLIEEEAERLK